MIRIIGLFLLSFAMLMAAIPANAGRLELPPGASLTQDDILELLDLSSLEPADRRIEWRFHQPNLPMRNQASVPVSIELLDFDYSKQSGRLTAELKAQLETGEHSILSIMAISRAKTLVAVPAADIAAGQIIGAHDLDEIWLDSKQLRGDLIANAADLIGQEARRVLRAGKPIRAKMTGPVRLVERGELVEVTYRRQGLVLSMAAEALEDGHQGELVRLRNLDSGKRLVARATAWRQAEILGDRP